MSLRKNVRIRNNYCGRSDKLRNFLKYCYIKIMEHIRRSNDAIDDYSEVYQRLPWKTILSYAIGHVLNDVCASMWFTYLLVFFHFVLQFDNWQSGLMLLIGQVADAVSTPFVGYYSDRSDDVLVCAYGKRKMWHLLGTVCVLLSFPFVFAPFLGDSDVSKTSQMMYYSIFIIIFQFGWAAVQISHLSLIPELTPNEHDRTRLTAIRYGFTVSSNLLVYVITFIVLQMEKGPNKRINPSDTQKFEHIVWSILVVGFLSSLLFHVMVKEPSSNDGTGNIRGSTSRTSVLSLLCNIQVYLVAMVYMTSRMFVNLSQVFMPLYLHETLKMDASALAVVPLVMFLGSLVMSTAIEPINRCCGRKVTYTFGAILGVSACLWIRFGEGSVHSAVYIYIIAALIGCGGSIVLVSSIGVTTDLIGDKTGSSAFVYGIMSFTDKLANGIAVVIIQDLHLDESNTAYYRNVLSYACGGSAIVGTVFVWSLIRRTRQRILVDYERVPDYNSIN